MGDYSAPSSVAANTFLPAERSVREGIYWGWPPSGSFASFVCRFAHLEKHNRVDHSVFFDADNEVFGPRIHLGEGALFRVERSEWRKTEPSKPLSENERKRGKYVALKGALPGTRGQWSDVWLEVRALLHKPLRYHPNIVHLLGLRWGTISGNDSICPILIMEYAQGGSLLSLQENNPRLPFVMKQKLCHDVAKGLSILHACGIVHGDLRSENVLIFQNHQPEVSYTAKLADFGGSVGDTTKERANSLQLGTWPYTPPDTPENRLDVLSGGDWTYTPPIETCYRLIEGVKQADVYSFGLLVWRTIIDGQSILDVSELKNKTTLEIQGMKLSDHFGAIAEKSIRSHGAAPVLSENELNVIFYVLDNTIQTEPTKRSLAKVSAALKGIDIYAIEDFLGNIRRNEIAKETTQEKDPERDEVDGDGICYSLGELVDNDDAQEDCTGYRLGLDHLDTENTLFEPNNLKAILSWEQQNKMVSDFVNAATGAITDSLLELKPGTAAYYLFQCHLTEFGVLFDATKVCYWLARAATSEHEGGVCNYAKAWLWRIENVYHFQPDISSDALRRLMGDSIIRGHRTCIQDIGIIIQDSELSTEEERNAWRETLNKSTKSLYTSGGAVRMPYFPARIMRQDYCLHDLEILDGEVEAQLGADYVASLSFGLPWDIQLESETTGWRTFDKIYVNQCGHGLLHYAASMGKLIALKHLVTKYKANINLPSRTLSESPLMCACISGHLDCAVFLLERGADPSVSTQTMETPMHWLCNFDEDAIPVIAKKLRDAGVSIDTPCHGEREDRGPIWTDWEKLYSVPVTPLGRAVILKSLPAIRALLALGADPLARPKWGENGKPARSAIELAALLTLPHILEVLLTYVDARSGVRPRIFNEYEMLRAAHNKIITPCDTLSLQSRLVRCGKNYRHDLWLTLQMLRKREQELKSWQDGDESRTEGRLLCEEVSLGEIDIVEMLLGLGHSANGSPEYRPIVEAVKLNHEIMFRLLVNHGAEVSAKVESNGRQLSLLQLSASRPRTSRSGCAIAEDLLCAGVAIDPICDGTCPAFALAVKNQDFELADLLLAYGADVNATYQSVLGGNWITVLEELGQDHFKKKISQSSKRLQSRLLILEDPMDGALPPHLEAGRQNSVTNTSLPNRIIETPSGGDPSGNVKSEVIRQLDESKEEINPEPIETPSTTLSDPLPRSFSSIEPKKDDAVLRPVSTSTLNVDDSSCKSGKTEVEANPPPENQPLIINSDESNHTIPPSPSPVTSPTQNPPGQPLPPGWEMRPDCTGRIYYLNHNTKTTTWLRPNSSDEGTQELLPAGWEVRISEPAGRLYYIDHNSKTTTWEPPSSQDSATKPNLPTGWEKRRTEKGRQYFVDHNTRTCYWDLPASVLASVPPHPAAAAADAEKGNLQDGDDKGEDSKPSGTGAAVSELGMLVETPAAAGEFGVRAETELERLTRELMKAMGKGSL